MHEAVFLGVVAHFLFVLSEVSKKRGKTVSPLAFVVERWAKGLLAIIGAIVGYWLLPVIESFIPETITGDVRASLMTVLAFGAGVSGSATIDIVGGLFRKYLGRL